MHRSLTKADIVEAIYNQSLEYNRTQVKSIVEDMFALMKKAITDDIALLLSGFGKFDAYSKDACKGP